LRVVIVVLVALAIAAIIGWANRQSAALKAQHADHVMLGILALLLLAYALMIATPFVPGIEIGLTVMMIQGPSIVPAVYLATVAGLVLAYAAGAQMPDGALRRLFADFGLHRAAAMIERIEPMAPAERLALLQARLPGRLGALASRFRYVLVALAVNLPGNSLIGGGGGILLVAGLSRLFSLGAITATMLVAVAPFPLTVWFFGIDPLAGFYDR
jgi:hypothetical protein